MLQKIQDEIAAKLTANSHTDPQRILRDSGIDIDRRELKKIVASMDNIAGVYQIVDALEYKIGSDQRDSRKMQQELRECGVEPKTNPICEDAYQMHLVLDAMHHYITQHAPDVINNRGLSWNTDDIKAAVIANPANPKQLLSHPQVKQMLDAAREVQSDTRLPELAAAIGIADRTQRAVVIGHGGR